MAVQNTEFPYFTAAISHNMPSGPSGGIDMAGVVTPC